MKNELNKKHNEIVDLSKIGGQAYERIFNMYKDDNIHYAYNILRNINIPNDIDSEYVEYIQIHGKKPWVQVSSDVYGTINLWWLICITNKIKNPVLMAEPGTVLRIIKPTHVPTILTEIIRQL